MKQWKMTNWQRAALNGMYAVACRSVDPMSVWFSRRAIEHLTWCDWHGYHTAKMDELIRLGWIENGEAENGLKVYRLTSPAHGQISVDMANAIASARIDIPQADMLPGFGMK